MLKFLFITFVLSYNSNRAETAGAGLAAVSIFSSNYMRSKSDDNFNNNLNNKNVFKTYPRESFYPKSESKSNDFSFYSFKNIRDSNIDLPQSKSINDDKLINGNSSFFKNGNCPKICLCQGLSIDCNNRELTEVPTNLPKYLIKM
jgi:hypothetical protein